MHRRQLGRSLADADRDRQGDSRQRGDDQAVDLQGTLPAPGPGSASCLSAARRSCGCSPSRAQPAERSPTVARSIRVTRARPTRARRSGAAGRRAASSRGRAIPGSFLPLHRRCKRPTVSGTRHRSPATILLRIRGGRRSDGARAGPRTGPHFVDLRGQGCGPTPRRSTPCLAECRSLPQWAYWSSFVGRRMSGERPLGLPVQRARFRPAPPDVPSRCPLSGNRRSRPERHQ